MPHSIAGYQVAVLKDNAAVNSREGTWSLSTPYTLAVAKQTPTAVSQSENQKTLIISSRHSRYHHNTKYKSKGFPFIGYQGP